MTGKVCVPMDEKYLVATARYIELNPVRAGVKNVADYRWSSYNAHIQGEDNRKTICHHERTGRPLGDDNFIDHLEQPTSCLPRKNPARKKTIKYGVPVTRTFRRKCVRACCLPPHPGADLSAPQGLKELPGLF